MYQTEAHKFDGPSIETSRAHRLLFRFFVYKFRHFKFRALILAPVPGKECYVLIQMEFSSVQNLCLHLISSAYQRCRLSEHICRISIILARSSSSLPSSLRISISDTGIGSCLEEYQYLKLSSTVVADNWGISDSDIHNYQIILKENGSPGITRLPSNPKKGATFRHARHLNFINLRLIFCGSEVCLCSFISLDLLLAEVHSFLQKNVAIQLVAEDCAVPGSQYEKVFLANECTQLPISGSNLELLKSGLKDYVLKHGHNLSNMCNSCFPTGEQLKVGSGVACCTENHQHTELVTEAVIVMSNIPRENAACVREFGDKTEVLYFKDFSPCTISRSCMKALKSTDWKRYGLSLRGIIQQDGFALLEWENLHTDTHIDIVLHSYQKQYPETNKYFFCFIQES
ncbi:putative Type 2 DNA topoisomerase 6 subunit B-like protein [Lupinus albus]|uniref:Putative Type 2 DNA topoisomerase 6 subunit B-like protein n=1 Tax=Lupinus albus TaxID=3870 RepID=A0A6A4QGW4_LUPAL|nr:putative Type 2 DNA topoisomerase 6 subunit B-like protein [Lupinus albus]